jgi:hypothetical protein
MGETPRVGLRVDIYMPYGGNRLQQESQQKLRDQLQEITTEQKSKALSWSRLDIINRLHLISNFARLKLYMKFSRARTCSTLVNPSAT